MSLPRFLPAFLSRIHGLSLASSGIASGFVYLSGGLAGCVIAGYLGDSHHSPQKRRQTAYRGDDGSRRRASRVLWRAAAARLAAHSHICLALAYALLTTYYGLVYSAIQDLVAPNQRGATMAIYFMAMYMCGASFGPLLTGRLSDFLAHRAASLAGSATVNESFRAIDFSRLC